MISSILALLGALAPLLLAILRLFEQKGAERPQQATVDKAIEARRIEDDVKKMSDDDFARAHAERMQRNR